jgi:hypothetical protein
MPYKDFITAASEGHLQELNRLISLNPSDAQEMIHAGEFEAFRVAAQSGHLDVMEKLMELAPDKVQEMVCACDFEAFRLAASYGHLHVLERLIELSPEQMEEMVCANCFTAFRWAAQSGHLDVMERLMKLAPGKVQEMVCACDFEAFRWAAQSGHLHVLERLIELAPDQMEEMVCANCFTAFRWAAQSGHLDVMERLMKLAPDKVQEMVCDDNFDAFRCAAGNGHLHVMERLMKLAPDKVQEMVCADEFGAFREAAENNYLIVMERLMELAPGQVQEMVSAEEFYAFREAADYDHLDLIDRLLNFPAVFAYAEMHVREYGSCVQAFMNSRLTHLTQEMDAFHATHPNEVFDIVDSEQAKLYFYMMRHFIRQQTPESLEKLNLLLSIPSVKALVHQEVTPNQSNELLRLAMSLNNQEAALILLNIPAVRDLAQVNNFYQQEQRSGLDLRALAQDPESSMTALTQDEQLALGCAEKKYQPAIQASGVPVIMNALKDLLAQRYNAHPATVQTGDGRVIELPLEFNEYQRLANTLSADTRERALESYYQHPDHTALRYLSKPNRWMSTDAHFVNRNAEGAWSTFGEYQPLISLLYLAAKDETEPAINGYTIETRIENFIKELAYIGRAHNWDASRINPTTGRSEEYDDLQGDKPSCYSGVKRRLFQSVQGHPLLTLLTKDIILQEIRDVVQEHFIGNIDDKNCAELHKAWQAIFQTIINGEEADTSILSQLNLSEEQRTQHIQSISQKLENKYEGQFNAELRAYLIATLNVNKPFRNLAEKFGGQVGLTEILETKIQEMCSRPMSKEEMRAARVKFFAERSEEESDILKNKKQRKNDLR